MGITAREDVAVGLNEVPDSKDTSFGARTIHFAHKFTGGETSLDLLNLSTPSELAANGFINPSPGEIAAAHLSVFKKNLKMALSRGPSGLELKPFAHYVASGNMVNFIGNLRDSGGAQAGEILFGEIVTVPANSIVVGDVRWIRGTRIIPVGQTLINIGYPYKVGENEDEGQAGMLKLKRNGVAIYRNVGNSPAVAGPETDGNFHEDDSGNGYGTTATLNNAPVGQADLIEFEVGIQISSGDMGLWGALEAMEGSIIKLADDAAYNFYNDTDITRYISTSPSAIQRRQFGDLVETLRQQMLLKYDIASGIPKKFGFDHTSGTGFNATAGDHQATRLWAPHNAIITRLGAFLGATAAGRKFVLGIYSDVGGLPSAKLSQTIEFTTTGTQDARIVTLDLLSPVNIVKDQSYWLTFLCDTTQSLEVALSQPGNGGQLYRTQGYSSTLPNTFGAITGNSGGHMGMAAY